MMLYITMSVCVSGISYRRMVGTIKKSVSAFKKVLLALKLYILDAYKTTIKKTAT